MVGDSALSKRQQSLCIPLLSSTYGLLTYTIVLRMAEYIESEPARKKAVADAQRAKLEALERQLGIDSSSSGAGSSEPGKVAGKKHRFDDTEYLEQSRDLVDGVKSAVAAGTFTSCYSRCRHTNHNLSRIVEETQEGEDVACT